MVAGKFVLLQKCTKRQVFAQLRAGQGTGQISAPCASEVALRNDGFCWHVIISFGAGAHTIAKASIAEEVARQLAHA